MQGWSSGSQITEQILHTTHNFATSTTLKYERTLYMHISVLILLAEVLNHSIPLKVLVQCSQPACNSFRIRRSAPLPSFASEKSSLSNTRRHARTHTHTQTRTHTHTYTRTHTHTYTHMHTYPAYKGWKTHTHRLKDELYANITCMQREFLSYALDSNMIFTHTL